jgi:hypothetical protein
MFRYLSLILLHPRLRPYSGWLLKGLIYWQSYRDVDRWYALACLDVRKN